MRKIIFLILFLVLIIFIIGCKSEPGGVEIKNVQYKDGVLLLTLNSNQSLSDVGIEIASGGKILCEKHKDLVSGTNHFEFSDCDLEDQVKVSVFPRQGMSSEKDFNLGLPILSIYVTDETQEGWEGIAGLKKDNQRAILLRYKISKNDMRLVTTISLNENQINEKDVIYQSPNDLNSEELYSLSPFFLLIFKEKWLNLEE